MNRITTSPGFWSRNSRTSLSASTIFVAPSSQTVWQRKTSCSPSPAARIPIRPASRSAAAKTSGGSDLTTLLRSRPSASKSVRTRPSAVSIPQWGSIRNSRIPSCELLGDVVALVGDEPPRVVGGRERVVSAGVDDLVEPVRAELRRAVAPVGEAGQGALSGPGTGGQHQHRDDHDRHPDDPRRDRAAEAPATHGRLLRGGLRGRSDQQQQLARRRSRRARRRAAARRR